jgi:hypothetical protein
MSSPRSSSSLTTRSKKEKTSVIFQQIVGTVGDVACTTGDVALVTRPGMIPVVSRQKRFTCRDRVLNTLGKKRYH